MTPSWISNNKNKNMMLGNGIPVLKAKTPFYFLFICFAIMMSSSSMANLQGAVGIQHRYFLNSANFEEQTDNQTSVSLQGEYQWRGPNRDRSLKVIGFYRYDSVDEERTRFDLREALFSRWYDQFEYRIGVGKVYWGVTESLQLVDIINQTDSNDSIDGDSKLGQPMLHGIWLSDYGKFDAFILPGFRPRTFPGENGRLRPAFAINNEAEYQAGEEEKHVSYAARWSNTLDVFEAPLDVSFEFFRGTSRDPEIQPEFALVNGVPFLVGFTPYYPIINQISSTLQYSYDGLLLKAETLFRDYSDPELEQYLASVSGFEYTFSGVFQTAVDVGVLVEYQFDERGSDGSPNHNDVFIGSRIAANDVASSELLFGFTQDLDSLSSRVFFAEASRRIGNTIKVDANILLADTNSGFDEVSTIANDDLIEVSIEYFF